MSVSEGNFSAALNEYGYGYDANDLESKIALTSCTNDRAQIKSVKRGYEAYNI